MKVEEVVVLTVQPECISNPNIIPVNQVFFLIFRNVACFISNFYPPLFNEGWELYQIEFAVDSDGFGIEGREAKDSEGAVPLNATLIVDLELVSWNSVETVTDDTKIIKKITKKGESYEKPNDGSTVASTLLSSAR